MTIEFITPLLPYLSGITLRQFEMDIEERVKSGLGFGMYCDEEKWMKFWEAVKVERERRNMDE
jgi:hypothetical protein